MSVAAPDSKGQHECQVAGWGSEAEEGEMEWENCTKNPGHTDFIPAPKFSLQHLPKYCRTASVLEHVRSISSLTVRLRVAFTSWDRPDGYCFSDARGSPKIRNGSGMIRNVCPEKGPCQCFECAQSATPKKSWHSIEVTTACHIVFNTEEAKYTKVDVFCDDERSTKDGRMKTFYGVQVVTSDTEYDNCLFRCATHDDDLAQELIAARKNKKFILRSHLAVTPHVAMPLWKYMCIIVSHPHGRTKHITVGELRRAETVGIFLKKIAYTSHTCPGSSGAFVFVIESNFMIKWIPWHSQVMWGATHTCGGEAGEPNEGGMHYIYGERSSIPKRASFTREIISWIGLLVLLQHQLNVLNYFGIIDGYSPGGFLLHIITAWAYFYHWQGDFP